jgi:hypothetical protein
MRRRDFIWLFGSGVVTFAIGCDGDAPMPAADSGPTIGTGTGSGGDILPDAAAPIDACVGEVVTLHDTYAQALYFDGTLGPLTGVITVAQAVAGTTVTMDFWHGHNGQQHRFTLEPSHFAALARGERVTLETTTVDNHSHQLFVDPLDETYRVEGAPDEDVQLGC